MNQIIKTKIDGVPVEIEITKMGPSTVSEIKNLESNISKEDPNYPVSQPSQPQEVKIVKIGEDGKASSEDVAKVKAALNGKDPATLIGDLLNSIENVPAGKDWWTSKVVLVNAIAIITAATAYFGLDLKIDTEILEVGVPILIAIINLYLRKGTNIPLSNRVIPTINKK